MNKQKQPFNNRQTLSELLSYSSRTFSITFDESIFRVYREKDKTLIEEVAIESNNKEDKKHQFYNLKDKYIFDYNNVL